jgi:hypothetical protein
VDDCGLFIDGEHPFIAASPDGLVNCECYGEGVCEIKVCFVVFCMHKFTCFML